MAYKNNINRSNSQSWLSSIGNKVKHAAEIAGAVKEYMILVECYIMLLNTLVQL